MVPWPRWSGPPWRRGTPRARRPPSRARRARSPSPRPTACAMAWRVDDGDSQAPPWWAYAMTLRSSHADAGSPIADGNAVARLPVPAPGANSVARQAYPRSACSTTSSSTSSAPSVLLRPGAAAAPGRRGAFQVDVFLGDVSWETSYSLPGRGAAASGPRRRLGRLAHLEPDLLPQLVHRRAARRAARGGDRGGSAASSAWPRPPTPRR